MVVYQLYEANYVMALIMSHDPGPVLELTLLICHGPWLLLAFELMKR